VSLTSVPFGGGALGVIPSICASDHHRHVKPVSARMACGPGNPSMSLRVARSQSPSSLICAPALLSST
jgi:hypothetical protein